MLITDQPYKVAETFALLGGLFPERIDLGIGRAPGGNGLSSHALGAPRLLPEGDDVPGQAATLGVECRPSGAGAGSFGQTAQGVFLAGHA
ncbi:hypothetical protein [Pseudomonas sp.]|uniref:hypothetical protein n=1 Tax=Pseudomonas sp. TaxID=306 RepID=UPI0028AC1125|nr:hypothetical protein [Pseudomonas sp.]